MNKYLKQEILFVFILLIFTSSGAAAQTTIRMMADQPEKLETTFTEDPVTLTDHSVIFGDNINVSGGKGPYNYQWLKNGENSGTGETLEVFPYIRSEIYSLRITDANNCSSILVMPGNIEIPSAAENEKSRPQISVYPVPASRYLTIDPGDIPEIFKLAFYNSSGDIILEKQIQGRSVITIRFPAGIYIARITNTSSGLTEVKRIVVL